MDEKMNCKVEVPIDLQQTENLCERNPLEPPLTMILQQAKFQMIDATNRIMRNYGIPAAMMDGIVAGILADIRSQVTADLLVDIQKQREGEKDG